MGLIKAHPFLLSSHSIYQCKLVSYIILYKNNFRNLLCKFQNKTLFSLFLSTILHSSFFFHFFSLFFFHKLLGFSTGDDLGRLNTQSIQGSTPSKAEFEFLFDISNLCECSSFSSILFSILRFYVFLSLFCIFIFLWSTRVFPLLLRIPQL